MIFLLIPLFHFQKKIGHLVGLSIFIQIWRWKEGTSSHLVKEYLLTKGFLELGNLFKLCCEQSEWIFVNNITLQKDFLNGEAIYKNLAVKNHKTFSYSEKKTYVTICKCEENVVRWTLCASDYSEIGFFIYVTRNNHFMTQTWKLMIVPFIVANISDRPPEENPGVCCALSGVRNATTAFLPGDKNIKWARGKKKCWH